MAVIISHNHAGYQWVRRNMTASMYNGAYYYSREIVKNIIPRIKTDRSWLTINVQGVGINHAIVFIHNNKDTLQYEWLKTYNDLILVCGIPETCDKVAHLGTTIYLPLSVDVDYVKQYASEKNKETAYCGRASKMRGYHFPEGTDIISELPRQQMLQAMARYKKVYAVGRCAIEAKILGCEVLPYDERFPDPKIWKILDNKDAVKILQRELDRIDGTYNSTK